MTRPNTSSESPSPAATRSGWFAKLGLAGIGPRLKKNYRLVLIAVFGLASIVFCFASLYSFIAPSHSSAAPPPQLVTAFALLDGGQLDAAREAAERIQVGRKLQPHEYGAPAYIIGASLLHEADETIDPGDRAERFGVASRYLERAHERGFPSSRETEGLLLLGRSLHESGHYAQAIAALVELEEKSAALRPTAQRLLASCYLRSDPPNLDRAIEKAEAVLAAPHLSPSDREAAQLLFGETLLARSDFRRCAELVAQIPRTSPLYPQAMLFQGRSLLAAAQLASGAGEGAAAKSLYSDAIDALREVHSRRASDLQTTREATYLIGVALRRSGNLPAAQAQFLRVRKTYYESPEGIAASLDEAEIAAELSQSEAALVAYQQAIEQRNAAPLLVNPWISDKQLLERLTAGYEQFLARGNFALAVKLAEALAPPLEPSQSIELVAAAHEQWANVLQTTAAHDESPAGQAQRAKARAQYRAAGAAYERLAESHLALRRYTDDIRRAGQNYAAGRDYQRAIGHYRQFLAQESKGDRPAVLVQLGEALLALERTSEAVAACDECIQAFPKDPAAYKARLLASRALLEQQNVAAAKKMLEVNLHHESLTPRSDLWRDSLFALGALLYDEGQRQLIECRLAEGQPPAAALEAAHATLLEGLRYLAEAIERYPQDPQATLARFQAAEAHRLAAQLPLARLQSESIESRRAALGAQAHTELQAALDAYEELTALLNRRDDETPLTAVEQAILRNAYFARGGVLYDMGQFERAIQAHSTATNRYQNEPAAVEAYVQIASCYRRLNKPLEARGTLEQAKLVMERIPADAEFSRTTRYGRDEWNTLLDWLSGT